jgi:hypothetical protein
MSAVLVTNYRGRFAPRSPVLTAIASGTWSRFLAIGRPDIPRSIPISGVGHATISAGRTATGSGFRCRFSVMIVPIYRACLQLASSACIKIANDDHTRRRFLESIFLHDRPGARCSSPIFSGGLPLKLPGPIAITSGSWSRFPVMIASDHRTRRRFSEPISRHGHPRPPGTPPIFGLAFPPRSPRSAEHAANFRGWL